MDFLRHSHASLLIEMGFNILMVSRRLGHEKVETTWQTYAHLYPDKEKMLAAQLDTVKVRGITANVTIEDQLTEFMSQFQNRVNQQPALIDISGKRQIIRWDPRRKEKTFVSVEEFEKAQADHRIDADLATAEIFQAGYLELGDTVYCLVGRSLPTKFL